MSEQTTTAEIREMYAAEAYRCGFDGEEAFDAWLAEHDAQVAARALREAAVEAGRDYLGPGRLITPDDLNARADRIERQEGGR